MDILKKEKEIAWIKSKILVPDFPSDFLLDI